MFRCTYIYIYIFITVPHFYGPFQFHLIWGLGQTMVVVISKVGIFGGMA